MKPTGESLVLTIPTIPIYIEGIGRNPPIVSLGFGGRIRGLRLGKSIRILPDPKISDKV